MTQKETILINSPIEKVWNFIEDPNNLQLWNPKVQRVTAFGNSGKSVGSNFGIMYMMNNIPSEMRGEIVVHEPNSRLTFRFLDGKMNHGTFVDESFFLTKAPNGVLLERSIDFTNAPIPWWGRIIMWIVFKTGKPVGDAYLVKLRDLIEEK